MEYIEAPKYPNGENPFVLLPQKHNDREAHIIYRGLKTYLMLNLFPYNAGHLLAVPFREVASLPDLSAEERTELMDTIVLGQKALTAALKPDGFNIGFNVGRAGGASFTSHLHCHIVPRWDGDTNFMPVLGDTRVLPASLDAIWARLREACLEQGHS
jgi:ATP adenylyltransferase